MYFLNTQLVLNRRVCMMKVWSKMLKQQMQLLYLLYVNEFKLTRQSWFFFRFCIRRSLKYRFSLKFKLDDLDIILIDPTKFKITLAVRYNVWTNTVKLYIFWVGHTDFFKQKYIHHEHPYILLNCHYVHLFKEQNTTLVHSEVGFYTFWFCTGCGMFGKGISNTRQCDFLQFFASKCPEISVGFYKV